jgi:hypothetical protein
MRRPRVVDAAPLTRRPRVMGGGPRRGALTWSTQRPRRGALAWWSRAFDVMSSVRQSGLGRPRLVGGRGLGPDALDWWAGEALDLAPSMVSGALARWAGPWTRLLRYVRLSGLRGGPTTSLCCFPATSLCCFLATSSLCFPEVGRPRGGAPATSRWVGTVVGVGRRGRFVYLSLIVEISPRG